MLTAMLPVISLSSPIMSGHAPIADWLLVGYSAWSETLKHSISQKSFNAPLKNRLGPLVCTTHDPSLWPGLTDRA